MEVIAEIKKGHKSRSDLCPFLRLSFCGYSRFGCCYGGLATLCLALGSGGGAPLLGRRWHVGLVLGDALPYFDGAGCLFAPGVHTAHKSLYLARGVNDALLTGVE